MDRVKGDREKGEKGREKGERGGRKERRGGRKEKRRGRKEGGEGRWEKRGREMGERNTLSAPSKVHRDYITRMYAYIHIGTWIMN